MKKVIKTAGIQLAPLENLDETLKRSTELIGIAASEGAQIACLPSLFSRRWFPASIDKGNFKFAEGADGPTITSMRKAADENNIYLIATLFEKDKDNDEHYNTAFLIDPNGEITGKYRKIHVPQIPLWEEGAYFKPGNLGFPVFDTPLGKIGILLCWDIFFPEAFRMLALGGAEIVFTPTASAFTHSGSKWERAITSAAHANGFFVFRVNRVGDEGEQSFYGSSFCAGPDGDFVLKPAGTSEGVMVASCDLSIVNTVRSEWVFLKDRRPECYEDISKKNTK